MRSETEGRTTMSDETWHKVKLDGRSDYKINDEHENLVAMFVREHAADEILADHAAARQVEPLKAALRKASSGPNFGDAECWCLEDYCIMLPSPRGHSARCNEIRAALEPASRIEGGAS